MKKKYIKNIILVMSGGTGARFGADCPKQYCFMNKRLVIDYVIDACRLSTLADEIIIVASNEYRKFIEDRYLLPVVCGGNTRPESVANGVKFIQEHYDCEKLIITNAVCPLATNEQYDKYFGLLDQYDYVLTTWKLAPALHRFDGERVDRDDFFNVMEPDAYRFPLLYESYDFLNLKKYIFHNMPEDSNGYYCFDYPYTMKLTYSHDLKLLEVMYEDIVIQPQKQKTIQTVNSYLSSDGTQGIGKWIDSVQIYMMEMAQKYSVTSYRMNSQTEANIVYEAESQTHGNIVFKFTPSKYHFHKEYTYYKYAYKGVMAELIGFDQDYNALVMKKVKPGLQVKFCTEDEVLRRFYDSIAGHLIPIGNIPERERADLPTITDEFEEYVRAADHFTFEYSFRKSMEDKARQVWDIYFADAPKFFLHRDLHRRNILVADDAYVAIDPRGAIGPMEFEFTIPFIIELREEPEKAVDRYEEMLTYFTKYCNRERLAAAMFIFWIYKMDDYVFQKQDNYKLSKWCIATVKKLYFENEQDAYRQDVLPNFSKGAV